MPILAGSDETFSEVTMTLVAWVSSFISCLIGLFVSLYLLISHDDLQSNFIQPVELSDNLRQVCIMIVNYWHCSTFQWITSAQELTRWSCFSSLRGTFWYLRFPLPYSIWDATCERSIGSTSYRRRNIRASCSPKWRINSNTRQHTTGC